MKEPCVYIITNKSHTVLYTGVTSNLKKRIYQHRNGLMAGFASKYNLTRLVYFETTEEMLSAIQREKQIKAGSRSKKIKLIESMNPEWRDLYDQV